MSTVEFINEEGAYVFLIKGFYPDHQELHDQLVQEKGWKQTFFKMMGKSIPTPRMLMFVGNEDIKYHSYSGTEHVIRDWLPSTKSILDDVITSPEVIKIFALMGSDLPEYNACLLNHYRDGNDSISMHSDKEAKDYLASVISLSLGGSRKFKMQRHEKGKVIPKTIKSIQVDGGDLMVMGGKCQERWKHGIDKVKKEVPSRISLTYRHLVN